MTKSFFFQKMAILLTLSTDLQYLQLRHFGRLVTSINELRGNNNQGTIFVNASRTTNRDLGKLISYL